ncbi:MAG TPA: spore cortex-lytic enzyme [Clostridia bacterium]|nr:spore cortex-lytic enzyme [Clostridia bacterium]
MEKNHGAFANKLALMLVLVFLLTYLIPAGAAAEALKVGSTGEQVKTLQTKLKRWGYYFGTVDGKYGAATKTAVQNFQRKNGLTADGVAGASTLKALGMSTQANTGNNSGGNTGGSSNEDGNLYLLAQLVYGEARGEPYKGQVAVAAVVLNRVDSSEFPNSISGVVYQPGAFDAVADGQINLAPDEACINAARDAINGWDPTGGCLYYYNPKTATNKWMLSKPVLLAIGNHSFFK